MIAANSLLGMYAKLGLVENALNVFYAMASKDSVQSLRIFREMQRSGIKLDKITLVGVLLTCSKIVLW